MSQSIYTVSGMACGHCVASVTEQISQIEGVTDTAVVDGYQVKLSSDLTAGQASPLTLSVSGDSRPVTDLQPYLTAYGHLVALREGDLAHLHVHPHGAPGDGRTTAGPEIEFEAEVPSAGRYRVFLDFSHGGIARTAEFTVPTGPAVAAGAHHEGGHR